MGEWGLKERVRRGGLAALLATLLAAPGTAPAAPPAASPESVDIAVGLHSQRIPRGFFGLSLEVNELARQERSATLFGRVIDLIRPPDGKRMLLRVGGRSADSAYWKVPAPRAGVELDDAWLHQLASLVRQDRLRVELDLNLVAHAPAMAVAFASAAKRALPRGTLAGLAVGNEPDLYRRQPWLDRDRIASTTRGLPRHWTQHYSSSRYVQDYLSYATRLQRALPSVPLAGPELTHPSLGWAQELLALGPFAPRSLTFHRYATATCTSRQRRRVPNAIAFLENRFSGGLAGTLAGDLRLARATGVAARVTEINSFTCGGRKRLAQSFATALWAPDALFELLRAGVAGINWHVRPELPNAPWQIGPAGLEARPELYGLALFARTLGPSAHLIRTRETAGVWPQVKAWAVRSTGRLSIVLLNKQRDEVRAHITLPGPAGAAVVSRMLAQSPDATRNVTLAGQTIGPDGLWHGTPTTKLVPARGGVYSLRVPGYSAALIEIPES